MMPLDFVCVFLTLRVKNLYIFCVSQLSCAAFFFRAYFQAASLS